MGSIFFIFWINGFSGSGKRPSCPDAFLISQFSECEIFGTPTFIIWDPKKEKEIGRIEGYTQKPRFFSQLNEALDLIEKGQHPGKREGSGHREEGSGGETHQEEGSGNSSNIMDHIYKTPTEAKKASEMLGLGGEIHSHETAEGTIYMPGSTM